MTELLQTIESIEEAINSIPQLEASLRAAFLALQPHSQLLQDNFQFPRQWQEIETHLQPICQSIKSRFSAALLTTKEGLPLPPSKKFRKELGVPENPIIEEGEIPEVDDDALEVEEEEPLPESINASGLLDFIIHNDRASAQIEISRSLQAAEDPVNLVLDCADFGGELGKLRVLFETLETVKKQLTPEIEISVPAKERALRRAVTWKYKYGMDFRSAPEEAAAAFLHFLIAFEIVSEFRAGKVCTILAQVLPVEELLELCHALQYMVRIPVIVEKMAAQGKDAQILAKILFEYLQYSIKAADLTIQNANDFEEHIEGNQMKVYAYESVINCVARYELEPVFPVKLSTLKEIKSGLQSRLPASLKNKMKKEEDKLDVARQVLEQTKAKLEMQLAMATQNSTSSVGRTELNGAQFNGYSEFRGHGLKRPQSGIYHDRETSYGSMPPVEAENSYMQNERVALYRKYPAQSWR